MLYTVEVYKKDARAKSGQRLVNKVDLQSLSLSAVELICAVDYPASKGFRCAVHETMVTSVNLQSGLEFQEHYDTPYYCSHPCESYWSM